MLSHFKINSPKHPIWLSVAEAAKLGGINDKTIRRAFKADAGLKFKVIKNRYQIELSSLVLYLHRNTKLRNKLMKQGLGQYW
jgi:AraC-like DNA-binding protein